MSTLHCKIAWSRSKKASWLNIFFTLPHDVAGWQMLKHAYRGRLRRALLVGAPSAFSGLWRMVKGPTAQCSWDPPLDLLPNTSWSMAWGCCPAVRRTVPRSPCVHVGKDWGRDYGKKRKMPQTYRHIRSYKGNRINRSIESTLFLLGQFAHLTSPPTFTFASAQALRTPRACLK